MAASSHAPVSRIEAELRRGRELMEKRQFAAALTLAQTLLAEVPENRDVLYLIAACERYLGRIGEALRVLERLEGLHPQFARLFQERGHCYRALGDTAAAISAYRRAVALNEALPASWRALEALLRAGGRESEAEHARALAEYLAGLPPAIVSASTLFAEGELTSAEHLVREYLQAHPQHVEGMRLLARIGIKFDVQTLPPLLMAGARFVLLPGQGHYYLYSDPVAMHREIRDFLAASG